MQSVPVPPAQKDVLMALLVLDFVINSSDSNDRIVSH